MHWPNGRCGGRAVARSGAMVFEPVRPRRPAGGEGAMSSGVLWAERRGLCCDASCVTVQPLLRSFWQIGDHDFRWPTTRSPGPSANRPTKLAQRV